MKWPDKNSREGYEVGNFILAYKQLPHGRSFTVEEKREKPDYFLKDIITGEFYGVELTSVYLSDRSVPDEHMKQINGAEYLPYNPEAIEEYQTRLIDMINNKIEKAKRNYDKRHPIILSIFVNAYISFHMDDSEWDEFVKLNENIFNHIHPFKEVVFWNPASFSKDNFWVFSARPSS